MREEKGRSVREFLRRLGVVIALVSAVVALVSAAIAAANWYVDQPSTAEKKQWNELLLSEDCDEYRKFLRANPKSPYKEETQVILQAARTEQIENWMGFQDTFRTRGGSDEGASKDQSMACAAAKVIAESNAHRLCQKTGGSNVRNIKVFLEKMECSCRDFARASEGLSVKSIWSCTAQGDAQCSGERLGITSVQRCGQVQ